MARIQPSERQSLTTFAVPGTLDLLRRVRYSIHEASELTLSRPWDARGDRPCGLRRRYFEECCGAQGRRTQIGK